MREKMRGLVLTFSVVMLLLMLGTPASSNIEEIHLRPRGYELDTPAYIVSPRNARDTLALIAEQDAELKALREHITRQGEDIRALNYDITQIEENVGLERAAWTQKNATLAKEVRRLHSPWALGFFGGYDPIRKEGIVGIGLVFSIMRF